MIFRSRACWVMTRNSALSWFAKPLLPVSIACTAFPGAESSF
jgi:hypothetical protein